MTINSEIDRYVAIFEEASPEVESTDMPEEGTLDSGADTLTPEINTDSAEIANSLFTTPETQESPWDKEPLRDLSPGLTLQSYLALSTRMLTRSILLCFVKVKIIFTQQLIKLKSLIVSRSTIISGSKPSTATSEKSSPLQKSNQGRGGAITTRIVLALVLAFALTSGKGIVSQLSTNPVEAVKEQLLTSDDPVTLLTNELELAYNYALSHNGSFSGFKSSLPILSVVGSSELILTLKSSGRCWSTGVAEGYPIKEVRYDPTGARCDESNLKLIQNIIK